MLCIASATISINSLFWVWLYSIICRRMRGSQAFLMCCSTPLIAKFLSGSDLKKAPILLAILTKLLLSMIYVADC